MFSTFLGSFKVKPCVRHITLQYMCIMSCWISKWIDDVHVKQSPLANLAPFKQSWAPWSLTQQCKLGQFLFLLFTNEFNCPLSWSFWLVPAEWEIKSDTKPKYCALLRMSHRWKNDQEHPVIDWMTSTEERKNLHISGRGISHLKISVSLSVKEGWTVKII